MKQVISQHSGKTSYTSLEHLLDDLPLQKEIAEILRLSSFLEGKDALDIHLAAKMDHTYPTLSKVIREIESLTYILNPVELFTIDNYKAHRKQFLEDFQNGKANNPRFCYSSSLHKLEKTLKSMGLTLDYIESRLENLLNLVCAYPAQNEESKFLCYIIRKKILDDMATLNLIQGLTMENDIIIRNSLATKYGSSIAPSLLQAAHQIYAYLSTPKEKSEQIRVYESIVLEAEDFLDAVKWSLEQYYTYYEKKTGHSFPEAMKYTVYICDNCASIDVRDKGASGPTIVIPNRQNNLYRFILLLRHEIDGHVRNSLNGFFHFRVGGGAFKLDDEIWYEGLAMTSETLMSKEFFEFDHCIPNPYYIIAIDYAEQGHSFVEVFQRILDLILCTGKTESQAYDQAWLVTYRVFRGHIDTTNTKAYAMRKDQAYLRGWILQMQMETIGLSHLASSAILPVGDLSNLLHFKLKEEDLFFPDLNVATQFFCEQRYKKYLTEKTTLPSL